MFTSIFRTRAAFLGAGALACAAMVWAAAADAVRNPPTVTGNGCTVTAKRPKQALIPHDGKNWGAKKKVLKTDIVCNRRQTIFLDQELVEAVPGGLNNTLAIRKNFKLAAKAGIPQTITLEVCRVTVGATVYQRARFHVPGGALFTASSRNFEMKQVHPMDSLVC